MRDTVNPRVIEWALKRCGKSPEDLRSSVSPRVAQWIAGEGKGPSAKQLEKLAKATHVLVPYFFEEDVPKLPLQIPDFRTLDSKCPEEPSPELYDVINQSLSRQDWLHGFLVDEDADKLDFIGSCKGMDKADCAAKMRSLLASEPAWARSLKRDEAVRSLREAIERTGVCVYAGSYVGNSTNRPLRVDEFRGFVLSNEYAPVIFINTNDTCSTQLFTLAHEFAHLLFGESGVDDIGLGFSDGSVESDCDAVAAEFLVPAALVHETFDAMGKDEAIEELGRLTKTSEVIILRRARDLGHISWAEFTERYGDYCNRLREALAHKKESRSSGGGPRLYTLQKNHLGERFPETIFVALKSEYLLYSDAYQLTGLSAKSFKEFFQQEGMYV